MTTLHCLTRGLRIAAALVLPLAAALAHPALAQGTPQKRGTLVIVVQPEPPTLGSCQSTSGPVGQVATKVYEGLLEYDFRLRPAPSLAQS